MTIETAGPRTRITRLLDLFQALHPRVIDLSLGRIEGLLEKLGRPQDRLPPVVHVAGTNGKGSTLAFLRGLLEGTGRPVHCYTSPHLVRFNERIVLGGEIIGDDALADLLEEVEAANGDDEITFFEISTAAAMLAFSRVPADFLLLETGLGGRYDATNVIARPAATAITPISLDHQQFLGETIAAIAGEKAGIVKPGVPVVVGPQPPEALAVIRAAAEQAGAPLLAYGGAWDLDANVMRRSDGRSLNLPEPDLPGEHQRVNAATALALFDCLDLPAVPDEAIVESLCRARWPARLQRLDGHRFARLLPAGWELWLDGGHNPAAGVALASWAARRSEPLHLIVGMLATKDPQGFLGALAAGAESLVAVPVPGAGATLTPEALVRVASETGLAAEAADSVEDALGLIAARAGPGPARVLICGSLYLAGFVLDDGTLDINPESRSAVPASLP